MIKRTTLVRLNEMIGQAVFEVRIEPDAQAAVVGFPTEADQDATMTVADLGKLIAFLQEAKAELEKVCGQHEAQQA